MSEPLLSVPSGFSKMLDWLFWGGLAVYVFVLPIPHTIALRNIAFLLLLAVTIALILHDRCRPEFPFLPAWSAYAAVALISLTYAVVPAESLNEIQTEILYCALIFSVATTWAGRRPIFHAFCLLLAAINVIMVSVTFWHASFGDSMDRIMRIPSLAMPGKNSNLLVSIMPLIALACWRFWMEGKRALASLLIILLAADIGAMTISYNRQAFIALGAGIACAGLLVLRSRFTWRRLMVFLVGLSLVAGLLGFQLARRLGPQESVAQASETVFSQDVRWELWRFSLEKISEQPWTGAGFGRPAFRQAYPEFMPESRDLLWHAHNMVINKGIQMGIPGIVTFLILWFMLVREFVRHLDASPVRHPLAVTGLSLLAAVFVKNMTDDFFVRDMALLFWLLVGILIGSLRRYENSERQPS
ncbi:MAG: hypothetical protein C0522_05450 [Rhodocyclaceae bacterium]|nr:hypothetical protein [Rhodocyclaceae bacterium]